MGWPKAWAVFRLAKDVWNEAAQDSSFSHLAIEVPGENGSNEWLEPVEEQQYGALQ